MWFGDALLRTFAVPYSARPSDTKDRTCVGPRPWPSKDPHAAGDIAAMDSRLAAIEYRGDRDVAMGSSSACRETRGRRRNVEAIDVEA